MIHSDFVKIMKKLGPEVPYMNANGGLMYFANCTRPNIAFATNLFARNNSSPTHSHWNEIKHIFCYLQGTIELSLFYPRSSILGLIGFADARYLSDPHKARSQTGYVSHLVELQSHGVPRNRLWSPHLQIMQNSSHFTRPVENVYGSDQRQDTFKKQVVYSPIKSHQMYLKTMFHVLPKSRKDISRAIEQNIFLQNSSHTPKNSRRTKKLIFSSFAQVTMPHNFLQKRFPLQP